MRDRPFFAECPSCGGSGEIVFAITAYAPGCGFPHESSDARTCEDCGGVGEVETECELVEMEDLL